MENKNYEYDSELDNFYIYSNDNKEEIIGSIPIGNFIYDIGHSGKVVGMEIDNVSQVFNVSQSLLEKAGDASLNVALNGNLLILRFVISLGNKELVYSNVIPREKINIVA